MYEGMYIKVRVKPDARKEKVTKHSDTEFEIAIKEPAKQNLANRRIKALLAETFGVDAGRVTLVTGHHSRTKVFDVLIRGA